MFYSNKEMWWGNLLLFYKNILLSLIRFGKMEKSLEKGCEQMQSAIRPQIYIIRGDVP